MNETQEKIVCSICEEEVDDDNYTYGNISEDLVCIGCEESSYESASTLVKVNSEGSETVRFTNISAYDQYGEIPSWFYDLLKDTSKVQYWKSTDPWRGHGDSSQNLKLKVLASGWTTGWADEFHQRKILLNKFGELLESKELIPPVDLYILVEPTSNVFSSAFELLVSEEDEEELIEWLEVVDYPIENIRGWLG